MVNPDDDQQPGDREGHDDGPPVDDAPASVAETIDQESNLPGEQGPPPDDA
jgi:hypothetical protein